LDKSQAHDLVTWRNCFSESNVLLVPTRADCFGVVFAEAAAFALPSIATNVGGVADAVAHNLSGFLFALDEGAKIYADLLERLAANGTFSRDYALNAYRYYLSTLNWRTAALSFTGALLQRLATSNSNVSSRSHVPSSSWGAGTLS